MEEAQVANDIGQSSELYRIKTNQDALINCSKDLIWSIDNDLKLITANKAYLERVQVLTNEAELEGSQFCIKNSGKK